MAEVNDQLSATILVQVDGTDLPKLVAQMLDSASVESSRELPGAFELRLRDPYRIAIERGRFQLGAKVRIAIRTSTRSAPIWLQEAEITALEVEYDTLGSWTVVRGYDARHRLQRGRRVAAYRKMTLARIVEEVAKGAGLSFDSSGPVGPTLAEVIQPNISDWDFIRELTQDAGLALGLRNGKLRLERPEAASGGTKLELGQHLLSLRVAVSASEHASEVKVRSWNPQAKKALTGASQTNRAATADIKLRPDQVASSFGKPTVTIADAPHVNSAQDAEALAQALAGQLAGAFAELDAVVRGDPSLRAGSSVELCGVGAPFDGSYLVSSVRHVLNSQDGYHSWITVSGTQDRTLLGLTGRNGRSSGQVLGLVPAIVTDTKDPEELGRVRVSLPWLDEDIQTTWARPLQHGGKGGGGVMVPEVDDEVLVGFEQGRIEHPYVLGGLYNGVDKPPSGDLVDKSSGSICRRSIASRSGNRVELIDVPNGANGVTLSTGDNKLVINLDKQGTTIKISSAGKIEISGDRDITIKAGGNAAIEAKGNLTLKAQGNLSAEATNVTAKAKGKLDLSADATATLKGQAKAELQAIGQVSVTGGQAELKGSAIATINAPLVKIN